MDTIRDRILTRKISIISYESAAGRTMLAVSLFSVLTGRENSEVQLMGFDVEKPDLISIFDKVKFEATEVFAGFPKVDQIKCRFCGACIRFCDYNALHIDRTLPAVIIDPEKCEACGSCSDGCNIHGISIRERLSGYILHGRMNGHLLTIGKADVDEVFLLPLICNLQQKRRQDKIVIGDVGPGNSAFVKASVFGSNLAVMIQRPARGWTRNIRFLLAMLNEQGIKGGIVVNKYRNEEGFMKEVKKFCQEEDVPLLGIVPYFGESFQPENYSQFRKMDSEIESIFAAIWDQISAACYDSIN